MATQHHNTAADGSISGESTPTASNVAAPSTAPAVFSPVGFASAPHTVSIKLSSQNYLFWRTQLEPLLQGQGLFGFVDGSNLMPAATDPAFATWVRQDRFIMSLIISSMSEDMMHLAIGRTTSQALWRSIERALGSSSEAHSLSLLQQLQSLRQGDSTTAEFISKAKVLIHKLFMAGLPLSLGEQNMHIRRGLRPELQVFAAALTARSPLELEDLEDQLSSHDWLGKDDYVGPPGHPTAMTAARGRGRSSSGRMGRGGRNSRGRGRSNGGRGYQPECQICGVLGHTAIQCYRRFDESIRQANMAYSDNVAHAPSNHTWFPDTGATDHATPDLNALSGTEPYHGNEVLRVGNGSGPSNQERAP